MTVKKLYRSRKNRVFGGVCGGIAEYFDIGAGPVRLVAFILLLPGFLPGFIPYIILWILIPLEPAAIHKAPVRENVIDV